MDESIHVHSRSFTANYVAEVRRGEILEAVHHCAYAEVDSAGALISAAGDPDLVTTLRSAAKPLQAIPLVTLPQAQALSLTDEELAICCASHPGLPRHAALAASVLALSGFLPDDLVCGPGLTASPLTHGCSGNHAGMLLTAHLLDAALEDYYLPDHPAQQLILSWICKLSGVEEARVATDGCGVPTFGLRLREMAAEFARLVGPGAEWSRIPQVMRAHPELIGEPDWIDVRLMQATCGRIVAKTGAEGLLCLGISLAPPVLGAGGASLQQAGSAVGAGRRPGPHPRYAAPESEDAARGLAIKILDGSTRALPALTLAILDRCGWLTPEEAESLLLAGFRLPVYCDSLGRPAAEVRVMS